MTFNWPDIFDNYGIKAVQPNDKAKGAYYLADDQEAAVLKAGWTPAETRPGPPIEVSVLLDSSRTSVEASFYYSAREGSGRVPEARMGRKFISEWLNTGDDVLIGNIGTKVYVAKIVPDLPSAESIGRAIAATAAKADILDRAGAIKGKPATKVVSRSEFARNAVVVAGAMVRAEGKCEMPDCGHELFNRPDGTPYLEVHHVIPLSEGGDDTLINAAALCPHCHRELHYGARWSELREKLSDHILKI